MMDDSPNILTWLRQLFSWSIAWYESWFFFQGTGVGQPQGLIHSTASKAVMRGSASTIAIADIEAMSNALLPSGWERAVWFIHPSALGQLLAITSWRTNGRMEILGCPVVPTGQLNTLGSRGDFLLVDPQMYVIGHRNPADIAISYEEPTAFQKFQAVWRVAWRGDGQTWTNNLITLPDASSTVSPYVVLNSNPATS
jgi:HK97 family phage major capsid protein